MSVFSLLSNLWRPNPATEPRSAAADLSAIEALLRDDEPAPQPEPPARPPVLIGYAAVWFDPADPDGTQYRVRPGVVERVMLGAFDRTLSDGAAVATLNHDARRLLGCQSEGTLRLSVDGRGLRFEIDPPDTVIGRKALWLVESGEWTGGSFYFRPRQVTETVEDGVTVRELRDVDLLEVGPCNRPAYPAARCWVETAAPTSNPTARADLDALNHLIARMGAEDE